jgi:hypothetical protein
MSQTNQRAQSRAPQPKSEFKTGTIPCTFTSVSIDANSSKFPGWADHADVAFKFKVRPDGHTNDIWLDYFVELEYDENNNLIADEIGRKEKDLPRRGVQALFKLFDTIGYHGGFNTKGDPLLHNGETTDDYAVMEEDMNFHLNSLIKLGTKFYGLVRVGRNGYPIVTKRFEPTNANGMRAMKDLEKFISRRDKEAASADVVAESPSSKTLPSGSPIKL